MSEQKKRHRWVRRKTLAGTPTEIYDCRCGSSKRPSLFKDILFRYPDGGGVSLWRREGLPNCPGPSNKKTDTGDR